MVYTKRVTVNHLGIVVLLAVHLVAFTWTVQDEARAERIRERALLGLRTYAPNLPAPAPVTKKKTDCGEFSDCGNGTCGYPAGMELGYYAPLFDEHGVVADFCCSLRAEVSGKKGRYDRSLGPLGADLLKCKPMSIWRKK